MILSHLCDRITQTWFSPNWYLPKYLLESSTENLALIKLLMWQRSLWVLSHYSFWNSLDTAWWRLLLFEDNFLRNTVFNRRHPLMEVNFLQNTVFNGRLPLMKDNLWWKTIFYGSKSLMEDKLWLKMILNGKWPWMENGFAWKMALHGKWPWMEHIWMEDGLSW